MVSGGRVAYFLYLLFSALYLEGIKALQIEIVDFLDDSLKYIFWFTNALKSVDIEIQISRDNRGLVEKILEVNKECF